MKKINSTGQMEIMGLLMIVILITVILLIIVTLDVSNPTKTVTEQTAFFQEQLIGTFGPTIMETTTKCTSTNRLIRDLVADCAFSSSTTCDDGLPICEYLNQTIEYIAMQTLDKAGLNYSITIGSTSNVFTTKINHTGCNPSKSKNKVIKSTPIVTSYGPMILDMVVCR